jgi:hypothetical protein
MKRLFAIAATAAAPAATPAHAGSTGLDELNGCVHAPHTVAGCLQVRYLRFLPLLSAVAALVLCTLSTAEAKHLRHYGHSHLQDVYHEGHEHQDQAVHPQSLNNAPPPSQASEFAVAITQVIHDCKEQAAVLQNMPTDVVIKTVKPNKEQLEAIERVRSATNDAAKKLNASCPGDVPAGLSKRLTTADQALGATKAALVLLRPAFVSVYASLDDEQKAHLVALAISNTQRTPQVETASSNASSSNPSSSNPSSGKPSSGNPFSNPSSNNPSALPKNEAAEHVPFGCEQWSSLLKAWPLNKIEVDTSLSDEARAELYELMASVYHAAGHLAASCQTDDALTPVARLDGEVNRIDMLRQSIDGIAPALGEFTSLLNDEQKARFNTALGLKAEATTSSDAGDKQ